MTNATKALVIAVVNASLGAAAAFGVGFSETQNGAILALANSLLGLWVGLTYKSSPKRIPEDG